MGVIPRNTGNRVGVVLFKPRRLPAAFLIQSPRSVIGPAAVSLVSGFIGNPGKLRFGDFLSAYGQHAAQEQLYVDQGKPVFSFEQVDQCLPRHIVHGDKCPPGVFTVFIDSYDIPVVEAAGCLSLTMESLGDILIRWFRKTEMNGLQRHQLFDYGTGAHHPAPPRP